MLVNILSYQIYLSLSVARLVDKLILKNHTDRSMASYSATCWWSRWEVMEQLLVQFGDVEKFLKNENLGSLHIQSSYFANTQKKAFLEIKLAAAID